MHERPIAAIADVNPPLRRTVKDADQVSFVGMSDVREAGGIKSSRRLPFGAVKVGFTRFQDGDVLFAKITPCMENGKGALADDLEGGVGCGSTEFHVLRAKPNNSAAYVYQLLQWNTLRQKAEAFMSGSAGQQRVPSDFFSKHLVFAPPTAVQQKIAAILASLDTAIEKTEALIEKHQQIKAGLMHDLFTRGVLPDGRLRHAFVVTPSDYQASELGPIPKDWVSGTLRACLVEGASNGIYKPAQQIGDGTLLVGQTALTEDRSVNPRLARRATVSAQELRRFGLATGDILVARVFATVEGVGRPALVPELGEPAVFESNMMRLRVDASVIRPGLLFEWLKSDASRRHIAGRANASNQVSVNQGVLYPLPVPVPPLEEQDRMLFRIEATDRRRMAELTSLAKLRAQKLGLMQDLLTGKVQVKTAEAAVPA